MEKIGMIGTGAMGLALLERLKLAGVGDVVCYDAYRTGAGGCAQARLYAPLPVSPKWPSARRSSTWSCVRIRICSIACSVQTA